jgi:NAD(P)H-dependent FMN reductase
MMKKVVAISGSLKRSSSNTNLLKAAIQLAPEGLQIELYDGIGNLPHFNPDIDGDQSPDVVKAYREVIKNADGILICTPEYAFAVPGVLKNSLDWLVASGEYMDKPVMAISASPLITGGNKAHESLVHTLKTISANVIDDTSLNIGAVSKKLDANGKLIDEETTLALKSALITFEKGIS